MNHLSKRNRTSRGLAALTAAALCVLGLELFGGSAGTAGAATTSLNVSCDGVAGDVAGSVSGANKSSKDLVSLLATFTGSAGGPSLNVNVDANAPDKVKKGSGPFDASFTYNISLPDSLVTTIKGTLKKTAIDLVNVNVGVDYSGAQTGSLTTHLDSKTIDFSGGNPPTSLGVTGKVPSDASGRVFYRPGAFSLGVLVNVDVAGIAHIGTLSLTCSAQGLLGSTNIQVPGAPNTPAVIDVPVIGGQTASVNLQGRSDITADDNNPIQWDSLAIVKNPNGASLSGGTLTQKTNAAGGFLTTDVQVCAPARTIPGTPGLNDVQTLTWGDSTLYYQKPFGAHPTAMKLKFDGVESASIPLSTKNIFGTYESTIFGATNFLPPTAAQLQSALEGISTIGAGNVTVTGGTSYADPYRITFVGARGHGPQPKIEISGWTTTPFDFSGYATLNAAIKAATSDPGTGTGGGTGGGTTTAPDPYASFNIDQLNSALAAGTIDGTKWAAEFGNALKNSIIKGIDITAALKFVNDIFPQPATIAEPTVGEVPVPDASTGPLCSQFQVRAVAVPLAFFSALSSGRTSVLGCTVSRTTPHKVAYKVRVKVNGRTRTVTRYKLVYSAKVAVKYKVRVHGKLVTKTKYVTKSFSSAAQACQA